MFALLVFVIVVLVLVVLAFVGIDLVPTPSEPNQSRLVNVAKVLMKLVVILIAIYAIADRAGLL